MQRFPKRIRNDAGIDYDANLAAVLINEKYRVSKLRSDDAFYSEFSQWGMPKAGPYSFGLEYEAARAHLHRHYAALGSVALLNEMRPGLGDAFTKAIDAAGQVSFGANILSTVLTAVGMTEMGLKLAAPDVKVLYECRSFQCSISGFEHASD